MGKIINYKIITFITSEGVIERFNVKPFLIHNFTAYQMVYIVILLIIGIFALENREL